VTPFPNDPHLLFQPNQFKIQTLNPLTSLISIQTNLYQTERSLSESWRARSKTRSGFYVASVTASTALGKLQSANNGAHVTLTWGRGGGLLMSECICRHCEPKAERRKCKVAIRGVRDLTLRTILFTIAWMAGSASPHMALQSYFQYAIECTEPRVFNWCDGVLRSMKTQLTKSKNRDLKKFGYGSILVSFFL
jgi:hypothetical protein